MSTKKSFDTLTMPNQVFMPPIEVSVDTLEGVNYMISKVNSNNENTIKMFAADIFGDGYRWQNLAPDQIKYEVLGFLLDQKELFEAAAVSMAQIPMEEGQNNNQSLNSIQETSIQPNDQSLPSEASSVESQDSQSLEGEESKEENLKGTG